VISNIENGTLIQIDSLTTPWTAYVQTSIAARSTTKIKIRYLTTKVNEFETITKSFKLEQNYPNPFNTGTTINFTIPGHLTNFYTELAIYNVQGKKIKKLIEEELPAGSYSTRWDGTDNLGLHVSSGIYFYQIKVGGNQFIGKMNLIK